MAGRNPQAAAGRGRGEQPPGAGGLRVIGIDDGKKDHAHAPAPFEPAPAGTGNGSARSSPVVLVS
ncbi:hypothetical protein GCM10017752_67410 [Streptomyces roseoviridis]